MARRRRRKVPFGTRSRPRPWPEAEDIVRRSSGDGPRPGSTPGDGPAAPPRSPGPPGLGGTDGGAGVREPRRPKPTVPGAAAAAAPVPDQFVDLSEAPAR
ncbi:MAG TPA: hypothetical protein VIP77_15620 [Jiangellaceae bacterium]